MERDGFGVNVRIYFATLLAQGVILFVAGCFNIPPIMYFSHCGKKNGIPMTILGSAICGTSEWVECETCNENPENYLAYCLDNQNVLVIDCDFDNFLVPGMLRYSGTMTLLLLSDIRFDLWKKKAEVKFDEDVQTASDYSVKVSNLRHDATDKEEWRSFFSPFAVKGHDIEEVISCKIYIGQQGSYRSSHELA